jgi:hypothetical protein
MPGYDELCNFENLYKAHKAARKGKRYKGEVIEFEMNLAENLCRLQRELQTRTYRQRGYYHFMVYEPKARSIYAPPLYRPCRAALPVRQYFGPSA